MNPFFTRKSLVIRFISVITNYFDHFYEDQKCLITHNVNYIYLKICSLHRLLDGNMLLQVY